MVTTWKALCNNRLGRYRQVTSDQRLTPFGIYSLETITGGQEGQHFKCSCIFMALPEELMCYNKACIGLATDIEKGNRNRVPNNSCSFIFCNKTSMYKGWCALSMSPDWHAGRHISSSPPTNLLKTGPPQPTPQKFWSLSGNRRFLFPRKKWQLS